MFLLTINFYPSFWAELIVATAGSLLGFGGAYHLYHKGLIRTRKDRLKYLGSLLSSVSTTAKQQARNCNSYSDRLKAQPFTTDQLVLVATRDPKRLADRLDQEVVYNAYLWKFGRNEKSYQAFKQLYSSIDYIDGMIDDMIKTNERIIATTWERKKDYANGFRRASDLMRSFQAENELKHTQPNLVERTHQLLNSFGDRERTGENLQEVQQVVVQPMLEFLYNSAKQHPKVTELVLVLQNVADQYEGIVLQAQHNAGDYAYYGKQLQDTGEGLSDITDRLIGVFNSL